MEIETLILDVWRHVFCSPEIMEEVDQVKPPEKKMTSEEDKFSTINLLQMSYPFIYYNLNK